MIVGEVKYMNERVELYEKYRNARMREVMYAINCFSATNYLHGSARERLKEAKRDVLRFGSDLGEHYLSCAKRDMKKVTVRGMKRLYAKEQERLNRNRSKMNREGIV